MIEQAIYDLLRGDADVAAAVGSRIYPGGTVPETPIFPYLVVERTNTVHVKAFEGSSGLEQTRFVITSLAQTRLAALETAAVVKSCLANYRGALGMTTIMGILIDDESDTASLSPAELQTVFGFQQDYLVWYTDD